MSERYEYSSPVELDGASGNYFVIPASIITNKEINEKRSTIFSFFSMCRGLDHKLMFSVNSIVYWLGKKPNRHSNGLNEKIIQVIDYLEDEGYIKLYEDINHKPLTKALFSLSKISKECEQDRFAVIYVDELEKILEYKNLNSKDIYLNNDILLLVFAYLRMKIYRRRNRLFPEEINSDNKNNHQHDINVRRLRSPDAYNCYYSNMAEDLGLSPRTVSKAITILSELDLIYFESLPRIKYYDDDGEKWRTDHTVFCNAYKREGNYLLISGSEYYLTEIENKKKKLNIISAN